MKSDVLAAAFGSAVALAVGSTMAIPSVAAADESLHYDVGFGVGPSKRFLGNKPDGANDSSFGGIAQLHADVALFPLVRVGAFVGLELSPPPEGFVREMIPFGVQLKVNAPLESERFKVYGFVGFGYTAVYTHSFDTTIGLPNATGGIVQTPTQLEGVSGSFFDIPFGVGATYKLRKPWELFLELRATAGFGFGATLYNFEDDAGRPGHTLTGKGVGTFSDNDGEEVFGLALVFGVQYDK